MNRITVQLGKELLSLLESSSKKGLLRLAESIPAQIKEELGFRCPHVRFHYDQQREGAAYAIQLGDQEVASGHLHIGRLLALGSEEQLVKLTGIPAMEPIYGTPGLWIEARSKDSAEKAGCIVVEPARVLAATLTEAIRAHAAEIVASSELQAMLQDFRRNHGEHYNSIVPARVGEEEVQAILRGLLRERVPIANLEVIFQALEKHATSGRLAPWLTEKVRQAMGPRLWGPLLAQDGRVPVFTLEAALEDALEALLTVTAGEPELSLGPSLRARALELLGTGIQHMLRLGRYPVLLCKASLRRALKRLAETQYPHLIVLSMEETPSNRVNNMETLSLRLTAADRLRVLTGRLARWWGGGETTPGFPEPGSGTPKRDASPQSNSEEPHSMESDNEFPADSNGTGRGAEEPQLPAADEETEVEPEMAAAMVLSGNFTKALTDRVMAALSHDEMMRLASGLVRLKHIPESRLEKLWNKLASMYAWDWRDEDDLIEFIKNVLRKGFKQEPNLTNLQKLALLVLSLPEETADRISRTLLASLPRAAGMELTRELAHLLHYPNNSVHELAAGEFLASLGGHGGNNELPLTPRFAQMEADRIAERDPVWCAGFIKRIWLEDSKDPITVFQEAARQTPERIVQLLLLFLQEGSTRPYISGADKAAIFISSVDLETSERMRAWLSTHGTSLPDPIMTPIKQQNVAREFLHMFYTQMAPSAFPRPN